MLASDSSNPMKIEMFKFISWNFLFAIMSCLFSFPEKTDILPLYCIREGVFADKTFRKLTSLLVKKYWLCQEYGVDLMTMQLLCSL